MISPPFLRVLTDEFGQGCCSFKPFIQTGGVDFDAFAVGDQRFNKGPGKISAYAYSGSLNPSFCCNGSHSRYVRKISNGKRH